MSIPLTGSFVPAFAFATGNPTWSALSLNFTNPTNFTFQTTIAPKGFIAPTTGDTLTVSVSIFDKKTAKTCQAVCWQMTSSPITYASGTMTGSLTSGSFNASSITGNISITTLTNGSFAFSISGLLASAITLPSTSLGQIPVTVQVSLAINSGAPTTWSTAIGKCSLTGSFAMAGTGATLTGGVTIPNNLSFTVSCTPSGTGSSFSGQVSLQNGSSTMATLWIQNGAIRANNTVYATLLNSGSTFSGFNIKCNAIKGTYTGGILTLNIPAEFVLGPSFSISPMIANITGTINITLT